MTDTPSGSMNGERGLSQTGEGHREARMTFMVLRSRIFTFAPSSHLNVPESFMIMK